VFLRAFYQDPKDLKPPVELIEKAKIYPLGGEASAKPMTFPNASGVPANMLPISDGRAFDALKLLLDNEGDNLAGPDALGMLASLGIVKGKPFAPDDKTRAILDKAAKTGYKMSRVIGFEDTHDGASLRVYPDRHWLNPIDNVGPHDAGNTNDLAFLNVAGNYRDLHARDWFFTNYYSISPGMVSKIPGKGAAYMIGFSDSEGKPLSGGSNYKLTLPANIPAANFWSLTLYEAENASGLANGQPFPSLGSRDKPSQNADGSTDLYLGRMAPNGKAGNWLATVPGKGFFAILRLYGPTEAAIKRIWNRATSSRSSRRERNDHVVHPSFSGRENRHVEANRRRHSDHRNARHADRQARGLERLSHRGDDQKAVRRNGLPTRGPGLSLGLADDRLGAMAERAALQVRRRRPRLCRLSRLQGQARVAHRQRDHELAALRFLGAERATVDCRIFTASPLAPYAAKTKTASECGEVPNRGS
jgi:Protein of unknown function (DUF1214)